MGALSEERLRRVPDERLEAFGDGARECRPDDYGLVLEGAVLTIGDEALRPGEIFALHRPELHFDKGLIHVKRQIALEA